jgi:hypothetical protein
MHRSCCARTSKMPPYQYSSLNVSGELRLLSLFPGSHTEPVRFNIFHAPFDVREKDLAQRDASAEKVQATLPLQWTVRRTLEGDMLFHYRDLDDATTSRTSWRHPTEGLDGSAYEGKSDGFDLPTLPTYEALSYTWGSTDNPIEAYVEHAPGAPIEGQSRPTTIQIGQNVTEALRHLRYKDKTRTLWIDAICINQKDMAERNDQVKRMDKIYKFAERVVVWLGPESPSSGLAMSTLEFLGRQVELTKDYHRLPSPDCDKPQWNMSTQPLPYSEETWQAIFNLLGRPWFGRLWILQEIQLANRHSVICCGQDVIEWRYFRRAISCLNDKKDGPSRELRTRMGPINSMCWVRSAESLTALLNMGRARKCSEPHDKVYAILGLIPPVLASKIHPDYSSPVSTVFKDVFLAYLDVVRRFDLIQRCNNQERLQGLPSWAPNWVGSGRAHPIYGLGLAASSISSAHSHYVPPDILEVVGTRISTISSVDSPEMCSLDDLFSVLRNLGLEKYQETSYVAGGSLFDAYAWAVCSGQLQDRYSHTSAFPTLEGWRDTILNRLRNPDLSETRKEPYFWHWVQNYTTGRRIIRTDNGYVGTVMGEPQAGMDLDVLLLSSNPSQLSAALTLKFWLNR